MNVSNQSELTSAVVRLMCLDSEELGTIKESITTNSTFQELATMGEFPEDEYFLLHYLNTSGRLRETVAKVHAIHTNKLHLKALDGDFLSHFNKSSYADSWCLSRGIEHRLPHYHRASLTLSKVIELAFVEKNMYLMVYQDYPGHWIESSVSLMGVDKEKAFLLYMSSFKGFSLYLSNYGDTWFLLDF